MGTKKLGDAFETMGKRIVASLIDIAIQQRLIKPLAMKLFGSAGSSSGDDGASSDGLGLIGSFAGLFGGKGSTGNGSWMPGFGGFRAAGGAVSATDWYVVGEKGPEVFAPGVSGTIIPNGGRGTRRDAGGFTYAPVFNAQGAGPREIDALRAEMRRGEAELPGRIMSVMADKKIRGHGRG